MSFEVFSSYWASLLAENIFSQISTTKLKIKTQDCMIEGRFPVIDQGQNKIAGYSNDESKIIDINKPVVIFGDHTRVVKWVDFNFIPGADGIKVLEANSQIDGRFFYHQLCSFELPDKGYARHFKFLRESVFVIPSLPEQKVIAEKLDSLLTQVESTKARLESIPGILKQFRQSVLAAAVCGELTEDWRDQDNLIADSNQNILTHFRNKRLSILPESWSWLEFSDVAEIASNLQNPTDSLDDVHIAPNHIVSGEGRLLDYQTIRTDKVTSPKHRFYSGQILYSKIRPYLCKVVLVNFSGLCSADMYPVIAKINSTFLLYWMLSPLFTDWASNAESRSVLPKINQKHLSQIPTPVPPIEEQEEIVRRVEELFGFADKVAAQVKTAMESVNHLTQSILAQAFSGELTKDWREQNPDLISGENSAAALLERIKAERAKLKPAQQQR